MNKHMSGPAPATPAAGPRPNPQENPPYDQPTSQVAREQAAQVGDSAADAGRQVADTGREQAARVAEQGRREARDLVNQARDQVTAQARDGQTKAAESLRALAAELREMADSGRSGPASDLVAQAGDRVYGVADWLDARGPGDLIAEVRNLARRRPGTFLVGAALAGVLAGRLTRGMVDANRDTGAARGTTSRTQAPGSVPPPGAYPVPEGPTGPLPVYDEPQPSRDQPGYVSAARTPPQPHPAGAPATPGGHGPATRMPDDAAATIPEGAGPVAAPPPGPGYPSDQAGAAPARHAPGTEPTTVGEYVQEVERGTVPPPGHPTGGPR